MRYEAEVGGLRWEAEVGNLRCEDLRWEGLLSEKDHLIVHILEVV